MNIFIVRHGQTDYNINGRYGGRIDVPLNETGINEAIILKEKLAGIKFDKVYSSPLVRAYKTARIITDEEIVTDERIIERSNGDLEGRLKSEIKDKPDFNDPDETRYNIENIVDFRDRINSFLDDIVDEKSDENILIVTHAGVGIYARVYFEGEPVDEDYMSYKLDNCEVKVYRDYTKSSQNTCKMKVLKMKRKEPN